MTELEEGIQQLLLWRAGILGHEEELTLCFHHQQLFGNLFDRRAKCCCGVLGSHQGVKYGVKKKATFPLDDERTQSKRLQCYS